MKRLDAFVIKLVREHPQGWRRTASITYGLLIAWHLWDIVHRNPWWGIDFVSAIIISAIWGALAFMWGRDDRCDEIERLVVEALGDPDVGKVMWLWAYRTATWQQNEIIAWMHTHQLAAVAPDDMPPSVRDLAWFVAKLRA